MKEHPILFKSEMVKAILEGKKTQTRRILKPQPDESGIVYMENPPLNWEEHYKEEWKPWKFDTEEGETIALNCPFGKKGDRLWVKETFCNCGELAWGEETCAEDRKNTVGYKADYSARLYDCDDKLVELETTAWNWEHEKIKWKPSIFMKRIYSRLLLEITNIRVERLNKITEKDAEAEGCVSTAVLTEDKQDYTGLYASEHYARLWEKINGEGSWRTNPFVWIIEFKRINK